MTLFLASLAATTTGCGQLLFRQDHRVSISFPSKNATVPQPLTIQWTARNFRPPTDGRFAVFLDRDPQPPGEGLDYFKKDRQGIFVVAGNTLRIDVFQRNFGVVSADQNLHDVTVVLLDRGGKRIGESAAYTQFRVR